MVADSVLPYFRGYLRQRGRWFAASAQTIGRTAIPFLWRYIVPAAKRVGADLLDIVAPEIFLTGKKFKSVAADVGKKTLRKLLGGEKIRKRCIIWRISPKTSRRCLTRRDIFSKLKLILDQQTIATFVMVTLRTLAWRFLTKFLFWNQFNFLTSGKFIPVRGLDESSIEFEFQTDRSIYLDMRDIHLQIKVGLQKGGLFDDFMKKDEHGKTDMGMSFTDEYLHYLTIVNNLSHLLLSNCD